jgi:hypothetical protein
MLVAVDPNTLQVLDSVEVPEPASVPHGITTFDGKTAIYVVAHEHALRYFWDPSAKKLSPDASWVVSYLEPVNTAVMPGFGGRVYYPTDTFRRPAAHGQPLTEMLRRPAGFTQARCRPPRSAMTG